MEMNVFLKALRRQNKVRPPVWFMRQAGRYHSHYQKLRREHSFMDLCKNPQLASEVTKGPIEDFHFDAAILFSDLLFPLEALGMGLAYDPSPRLDWHLRTPSDISRLKVPSLQSVDFQKSALQEISKWLDPQKGLIGFVGAPLTLYCYAVEGSHAGDLSSALAGFDDGRWEGFVERILSFLAGNMALQVAGGAQTIALFDTCAGEFDASLYEKRIVPAIAAVIERFRRECPETPIIYYSKKTDPAHWRALVRAKIDIQCLGVDWRHNLAQVLEEFGDRFSIQGNIDPQWLHLPATELEIRLRKAFGEVAQLNLDGWVCGLGHGVLQHTPEDNVRLFLRLQKEIFGTRC